MTEASFVPDISHTVTDFPSSSPRRGAPRAGRRALGRAGSPSASLRRCPRPAPLPRAPRLRRAPGSETPRPIIPHIISLSRGQQIPINLPSKLFPILDQATSVCVGEGRPNRPTPPLSAPLPPSLLPDAGMHQILSLLPAPRHPEVWLTVLPLHPPKQLSPTESENSGVQKNGEEGVGVFYLGDHHFHCPILPTSCPILDPASLCSPSLICTLFIVT